MAGALVARTGRGSPIRPATYSKAFRRQCATAGVPAIRLHDTRHTAATRMLDSGTTVSATAKWLGHDPAMTLRVYGHVYEDPLASAGDVLLGGMSLPRRLPLLLRRALSKLCVQLLTGRSRRSMTYAMFLGEGVPTSVATGAPS
jgi:hypothetical protein